MDQLGLRRRGEEHQHLNDNFTRGIDHLGAVGYSLLRGHLQLLASGMRATSPEVTLMLIWRGWGFLAAVLLFGGLLAAQFVVEAIAGEGSYSRNSAVYGGIGVAIAGIVTFLLGQWLERRNPPRQLVDQKTGEQVVVQDRHDLFFVPMKYWGLIGVVGGIIIAVTGMVS